MNSYYQDDRVTIYHGDCLEVIPSLEPVNAVIADPPYGTTYAPWDSDIPLDALWLSLKNVIRQGAPIILTSSQPFTSTLIVSNLAWFRCEWVWDKVNAANFANANKQPLKVHENVVVFCERQSAYHPQKSQGAKNHKQGRSTKNVSETRLINERVSDDLSGMKFPKSIQTFPKHSSQCGLHPTQKPVDLMRYFIRTYTDEGDTVLDFSCGSGTTLLAARLEGRKAIGIEIEEHYCEIAAQRIAQSAPALVTEKEPSEKTVALSP